MFRFSLNYNFLLLSNIHLRCYIYCFYHLIFNNILGKFYETEIETSRSWTFSTLTVLNFLLNFLFRKSSCENNIIILAKGGKHIIQCDFLP